MARNPHADAPLLRTLSNGLTLLAAPMPRLASAAVAVFVRAGSRDESQRLAGLSHFVEHMAFKGTATRSVQAINLAAESLGADMNAYTDKDATCYHIEGLGEHLPVLLELLADIVLHSSFPDAELEREREVILQECIECEEDPQQLSYALLDRALWGRHPMGQPIIGTPRSIAGIGRGDLIGHVARHHVAGRIVVAAAGGIDAQSFFEQAERCFAGVPAGHAAAPHDTPPHLGQARARRLPGVSQTYLTLAWPAASRAQHPQLAELAATLFGGGMSAPLLDAVRERLGLAYSVGASADVGDAHGAFVVDAITTPDKIAAFTSEVARLLVAQARGPGAAFASDLARAKNQLAVSLVRTGERPLRLLQHSVEQLWATGRVPGMVESIDAVQAVDAGTLRQAFDTMLAQPPATVLVGAGATASRAREVQAQLQAG